MKTGRTLAAALIGWILCSSGTSLADEVRLYGAASLALGGAHVANADGADSIYSNPAGLGVLPGWELSIPLIGGGWLQHNGLMASLSDIEDMLGQGQRFANLDPTEQARVVEILQDLAADPAGGSASVSAGIAGKFRNFGFAVLGRTTGGVGVDVDLQRVMPGNGPNGLTNNRSAIDAATLSLLEFRAGYAHSLLPQSPQHQVYVGGAARVLRGWTSSFHTSVQQIGDEGEEYYPDLWGPNSKPHWGVDLDLGLLYCFKTLARAGFVMRGLLNPDFPIEPDEGYAGPDSLSLGRQVRLGIALTPGWGFRIATDLDLTKNQTALSDIADRQLGVGLEKELTTNFALRAGFMDNLDQPSGVTLTGGVRWSGLDLTLAYSPRDGFLSSDQVGAAISFHIDHLTRPGVPH